ncbi:MAG: efflux RND transporter periplasmic adaptor subunit [Hyphomicrobiaceae bacterium]
MVYHPNSGRRSAVTGALRVLAAGVPLAIALPEMAPPVTGSGAEMLAAGPARAAARWFPIAKAEAPNPGAKVRYTCPMHPHYISDHPGNCPICGMELVKMAASGGGAAASSDESRNIVTIAPEVVQNMGVRIAPVERASFGRTVRATAMVMENERTRSVMTARVEGWVEDLKITAVGDPVKKGMKLFELFAPELVVSQRDYLIAMRERDKRRLESTEARLRAFGLQDEAMRRLAQDGQEMQRVPFYADRDGVIAELPVVNGEYLKRGATVLRIQDYSKVWLLANVAEKDLGALAAGTRSAVTFPNLSGHAFDTQIDYVYPTVDAKTRTGRVRMVIENKDGLIRPGSFADVSFEVKSEPRIAVKSEAVLHSERGAHVVVSVGEGRFEPRRIETGIASGGWTEVRRGLAVGEQVVVSSQFLIDSESAIAESFRKLERMQTPLPLLALTTAELAMVDHMVDAAIYLHEALVDGYAVEPKFLQPARDIRNLLWSKFGKTKLGFVLDDAARAIGEAQSARTESETKAALAKLTEAMKPWMMEGVPKHYAEKKVAFFREGESGRQWIQRDARPVNPFGKSQATLVPWPVARSKTPPPASPAKGSGIGPSDAAAEPAKKNGG